MNLTHEHSQESNSTPERVVASVTPQQTITDHSFILQTIMELHKATEQLTSSVEALQKSIEKQDAKLDKVQATVASITYKIYAATVILAIVVTVGGFIVNKYWV